MKVRVIAFLAVLGLTIAAAIVGNVLESKGLVTRDKLGPRGVNAVIMVFFGLFGLLCAAIVPLALRFFLVGQVKVGNGQLPVIKWMQAHENGVVAGFWAFMLVGFAIIYFLAKDHIVNNLK